MKHTPEKHSKCARYPCMVCDGGLFICTVCHTMEGALTTNCCGMPIGPNLTERIYAGRVDYVGDEWVLGDRTHPPINQWRVGK